MRLLVTNIQRFSMHDGDGIRTTVFVKGCPLSCTWCHNPETQSPDNQILYTAQKCIHCGDCMVCPQNAHVFHDVHVFDASRCTGCLRCTEVCAVKAVEPAAQWMTLGEILSVVLRDRAFYGESGGLTLSGGEPMLHPKESIELLRMARQEGITTALETCGFFASDWLEPLAGVTDDFLWDYKDSNDRRHRENTGVSNELILQNLFRLDGLGGRITLRCIIVRTVNDTAEHLEKIAEIFHALRHCRGVSLLPYHPYGGSKSLRLGQPDHGNAEWVPGTEAMSAAASQLEALGVTVWEG